MQITHTPEPKRPQLVFDTKRFEEITLKPEDASIEAQTYMLTPVGRKLVQLIFELIKPITEVTIKAVGSSVTIDTGTGIGPKLTLRQYALLDSVFEHLDNLAPEAFSAIPSSEISSFVDEQATKAGVPADCPWWCEHIKAVSPADDTWWQNATNQGSAS